MTTTSSYIIRGGIEGRERLRLLSRVMWPTTQSLFARLGIGGAMSVLDVGCGGGDVTYELAALLAPSGRAVGTDIDETKLELARAEAAGRKAINAEFRLANAFDGGLPGEFDAVYARFLLTHLPDPQAALRNMWSALKPGGVLMLEDIDFSGSFCVPEHPAYTRYCELYTQSVTRRGADPNIGPRLPGMLAQAGCERVSMNVVQPAGISNEAKLVSPLTMENIAEAVLAEGLADADEIESVVTELYELARDTSTAMSIPRVVQAWAYRPAV